MPQKVDVSIIIATYNRASLLRETLESFFSIDTRGIEYELIVVDNNSNDNTASIATEFVSRSKRMEVVKEAVQGLSSARNRGIEAAHGNIIAFIDDDVEFGREWLKEIIKPFRDPSVWCVTGKVRPYGEINTPTWLPSNLNFLLSVNDYGNSRKILSGKEKPIGCNMAFRKEVFESVGTFDPNLGRIGNKLTGGEEVLIYIKMRGLGRKAIYSPEAIVLHKIENKLSKEYVLDYAYWLGVSESYIEKNNQKLRFALKYIRSALYLSIGYPTSLVIGQFVKVSDSNIMYDRYLCQYCLGYLKSL